MLRDRNMDEMIGQVFDHYRIDKLLGQGGMGSVYEATDISLQRKVAFKMMHPHLAAQEQFQKRFVQEARAVAALNHPHIVQVYHFSPQQGRLFLVMELVTGGSLRNYLVHLQKQKKLIELPEALELTRQLADGLHYAHQQDMAHRDIKPENVLLHPLSQSGEHTNFRGIITDFGLAKVARGLLDSVMGQAMGTLPYMSPEQCLGESIDRRTDIYSLGVMLYELVCGQRPFSPQSVTEAIRIHQHEPLPPVESLRPGLPLELEEIITRCLEKSPNDRYQNAEEIARALRGVIDNLAHSPLSLLATIPEKTDSLATYLMSQPIAADVPDYTRQPVTPSVLQQDRLVVISEGRPTQVVALSAALRIGRADDNELVLKSGKVAVSRQHARIERVENGMYRVMDLGSTNGTYLGDERLNPNQWVMWSPGTAVRIGDYWLQIEPAMDADSTQVYMSGAISGQPLPPAAMPTAQNAISSTSSAVLEPANLSVMPGTTADTRLQVSNQTDLVDHFSLEVTGLPAEWVTINPQSVNLMPGAQETAFVRISPPRHSESRAGTQTFSLHVASRVRNQVVNTIAGQLQVEAFHDFTSSLTPERVRAGGEANLTIVNQGNAPNTYRINAADREEALEFEYAKRPVVIEPGQSLTIPIEIAPKSRTFIGGQTLHPFAINVTSVADERSLPHNGEVMSRAVLPSSIVALAGALAALACLVLTMGFFGWWVPLQNSNATATAAQMTGVALAALDEQSRTETATVMQVTQTAQILHTETAIAGATQTALAQSNATEQFQATQVAGTQQAAVTQTLGAQAAAADATNAAVQVLATQTAQAGQAIMTLTAIADNNATSIAQTVSAIATQTAQAVSPTPPILVVSPFIVSPVVVNPGIIVELFPTATPTTGFVINPGLIQVNPNILQINPGIILLPTPTPCPGFLTTRLVVGERGRVLSDPPFPNNVRNAPDSSATLIGQIPAGAEFDVLEGATCNDNAAWYRVRYGTLIGWTAEGLGDDYFVEPVED